MTLSDPAANLPPAKTQSAQDQQEEVSDPLRSALFVNKPGGRTVQGKRGYHGERQEEAPSVRFRFLPREGRV